MQQEVMVAATATEYPLSVRWGLIFCIKPEVAIAVPMAQIAKTQNRGGGNDLTEHFALPNAACFNLHAVAQGFEAYIGRGTLQHKEGARNNGAEHQHTQALISGAPAHGLHNTGSDRLQHHAAHAAAHKGNADGKAAFLMKPVADDLR